MLVPCKQLLTTNTYYGLSVVASWVLIFFTSVILDYYRDAQINSS